MFLNMFVTQARYIQIEHLLCLHIQTGVLFCGASKWYCAVITIFPYLPCHQCDVSQTCYTLMSLGEAQFNCSNLPSRRKDVRFYEDGSNCCPEYSWGCSYRYPHHIPMLKVSISYVPHPPCGFRVLKIVYRDVLLGCNDFCAFQTLHPPDCF